MKHLLALGLSLGLLAACIPDVMNTKPEVRGLEGAAKVQTVTDPDSGTKTTLRPGGELRLKLDSNPTTGYFWYLKDMDSTLVELVSEDYYSDPAPEGMTGVGGHQLFVLKGLAKGKTTVTLSYERSPEDVSQTLELPIKVVE